MPVQPVRLRVLLEQRHWQNHRTFCAEYEKAARSVDPRLRNTAPSRAQLHRWLSGDLRGLPYGDHCRILEKMFPGWSAAQLFETVSPGQAVSPIPTSPKTSVDDRFEQSVDGDVVLVTSGADLSNALIDVVRNAQECLVAVGSRSRAHGYLQEIEQAIKHKPSLIHYRILIGPLHSQVLKDHLVRLIELRCDRDAGDEAQSLHISIINDLTLYHERFFVASERAAVITLPSAHSPMNFDTGLIVRNPMYVQNLLEHGKALYSKNRLECLDAVNALEVL